MSEENKQWQDVFTTARCPICHKQYIEGFQAARHRGHQIKVFEFDRFISIGMDEFSIGLLECIRRYNGTCNDNYNLLLHISELLERIKSIPVERWDFRQIYLKEHNLSLQDLKIGESEE